MTADIPLSTYRLQLSRKCNFSTVTRLVDYLHELGITHVYLSPCLRTRTGSQHGYDIADFNSLNPEVGTRSDLENLSKKLKKHGMSLILDFVPNHMGIFENPWWLDVLENGQSSSYAAFFDIDWDPVKDELKNKVLLPILEDFYGSVLERKLIKLAYDKGAFQITYHEHHLPVDPGTYPLILEPMLAEAGREISGDNPHLPELQSIIAACRNLPLRTDIRYDQRIERAREKEVIKRRLNDLCSKNSRIRLALQTVIKQINGQPDIMASPNQLHELLEQQVYRFSYWRVAADEINYRRFFDINELAGINMEDEEVFTSSHRLLFDLLGKEIVNGLRIDHVDGLFAPAEYLRRLQDKYSLEMANKASSSDIKNPPTGKAEPKHVSTSAASNQQQKEELIDKPPLYVVVEKILSERETLRSDWPVYGTTGYEFGNSVNGLFIKKKNTAALLGTYRMFIGNTINFQDVIYWSKNLVLKTAMAAELNMLAHQLNKLSEHSRYNRDFTLNNIRDALQTVIACFPVYRTYIDAYNNEIDDADRQTITTVITAAKKRNIAINFTVFDFISDSLLLKFPPDMDADGRDRQRSFVMRFQQLTGPVMAKGLEDTAFYIFTPLISLNEVGGNPLKFGTTVEEFHAQNLQRLTVFPNGMMSTSTHDSKRSEDVRARINVLSELPEEWRTTLTHWRNLNKPKKAVVDAEHVPGADEEYYLYQVILGSYPFVMKDNKAHAAYIERIKNHMVKALRESKIHSSWISPNTAYEEALNNFIEDLLYPSPENVFLPELLKFYRAVSVCGMYNSLSQTLLKIFSPGVPDIYRGNEVWIFDLTDPDNRRPVSFTRRTEMLQKLKKRIKELADEAALCSELLDTMEDGRIKLYVTWKSLTCRRNHGDLFKSGNYLPLSAEGAKKNNVCAFMRRSEESEVLVVAPVLLAGLTNKAEVRPEGAQTWGDTYLSLPKSSAAKSYRNIFTGERLKAVENNGAATLMLSDIFKTFPFAALELIKD